MKWIKTHENRIVNLLHVEDVFLNEEELTIEFSLTQDVIKGKCDSLESAKDYFKVICKLLEVNSKEQE